MESDTYVQKQKNMKTFYFLRRKKQKDLYRDMYRETINYTSKMLVGLNINLEIKINNKELIKRGRESRE